jgi:hypothetical protein
MRQTSNDCSSNPESTVSHRGMVPVARSRSRDALFEVCTILSDLERRARYVAEVARLRAALQRIEDELPNLSPRDALEQAERLRGSASDLYARSRRD